MAHKLVSIFFRVFTTFWLCINSVSAQDSLKIDKYQNNVFLEVGGAAGIYSLNYERNLFNHKGNIGIGRVGLSVWEGNKYKGKNTPTFIIPIMINYLIGSDFHHIELGLGPTFVIGYMANPDVDTLTNEDFSLKTKIWFSSFIGYRRYLIKNDHIMYKIGFIVITADFSYFQPWFGVGVGYRF